MKELSIPLYLKITSAIFLYKNIFYSYFKYYLINYNINNVSSKKLNTIGVGIGAYSEFTKLNKISYPLKLIQVKIV